MGCIVQYTPTKSEFPSTCGTTEKRSLWTRAAACPTLPIGTATILPRGTMTSRTMKVPPSLCILSANDENAIVEGSCAFCSSNIISLEEASLLNLLDIQES